jgi:hypothetical protein
MRMVIRRGIRCAVQGLWCFSGPVRDKATRQCAGSYRAVHRTKRLFGKYLRNHIS